MNDTKQDIRNFSLIELQNYFVNIEESKFRATQVYEWLWKKSCLDFDEMTNLSLPLREKLKATFSIPSMSIYKLQKSNDGTMKVAFLLSDKRIIEGVIIPVVDDKRFTACISSQVGCSLSCKFCATGFLKRERNLLPQEIYDQVVLLNNLCLENFDFSLSNVVFMGMGEPLLNYKNVVTGIEKISSENGLNMAARRITISTAGIAKMIKKLADEPIKVNLALSLHAANDTKRDNIMPINEQNSLDILTDALNYFNNNTKTGITYEYILLSKFNDTVEDALELVKFVEKVPAKINIIEYNAVDGVEFEKSSNNRLHIFVQTLIKNHVKVTVRKSRGEDIDAACGQLANKH